MVHVKFKYKYQINHICPKHFYIINYESPPVRIKSIIYKLQNIS